MDETKTTPTPGAAEETAANGAQENSGGAAAAASANAAKEQDGLMQKFMDFLSRGEKKSAPNKDKPAEAEGGGKTYTQAEFEAAVAEAVAKASVGGKKQPEKPAEGDMQKELAELKAQLLSKELHEAAAAELQKQNLPADLAALLDYSSKEKMEASLKTLQDSFTANLETAVKERLKGKTPLGLGTGSSKETIEEQIARAMREGVR